MTVLAEIGLHHVSRGEGIEITVVGMTLVFAALVLISFAIALLPRLLDALEGWLPTAPARHAAPPAAAQAPAASGQPAVDEALAAAIGFVFHHRQSGDS